MTITESQTRGYLYGEAFSKYDHDWGSTHQFNVWPISEELYMAAKAVGWDIDALPAEYRPALQEAWTEYREHTIAILASGDHP